MIINNVGTPVGFVVTGTGSSQKVEGELPSQSYAVVQAPGKAPFKVVIDTTLDVSGIKASDALVTRYFDAGWIGVVSQAEN